MNTPLTKSQKLYIRQLVVGGSQAAIKELLLSELQKMVYRITEEKGALFSRELSSALDISIQYSSLVLDGLHTKGYLKREVVVQDSGGNEWKYSINKENIFGE